MDNSACIDHGRPGDKDGYGKASLHNKTIAAHRLAYIKAHGLTREGIDGKVIRHSCDNPRCINPDHLLIGTHADNVLDKVQRGRARGPAGERSGHAKLTAADAEWIRSHIRPRSLAFSSKAMAKRFGVTPSTISSLLHNKTWRSA